MSQKKVTLFFVAIFLSVLTVIPALAGEKSEKLESLDPSFLIERGSMTSNVDALSHRKFHIMMLANRYAYEQVDDEGYNKIMNEIRELDTHEMRLFFDFDHIISAMSQPEEIAFSSGDESGIGIFVIDGQNLGQLHFPLVELVGQALYGDNTDALSKIKSLSPTEQEFVQVLMEKIETVAKDDESTLLSLDHIGLRNLKLSESIRIDKHPIDLAFSDLDKNLLLQIQQKEPSSPSLMCQPWEEACTVWSGSNWGPEVDCPYGGPCEWAYGYNPKVGDACEWKCDIYVNYTTPSNYRGAIGTTSKARCAILDDGNTNDYLSGKTIFLYSGGQAWWCGIVAYDLATQTQVTPYP